MSGFDEDPAAEFLAREQDELAGLEDEVKPAAVAVPTLNGDDPTNSASSFEMVENNDQEFAREKVNSKCFCILFLLISITLHFMTPYPFAAFCHFLYTMYNASTFIALLCCLSGRKKYRVWYKFCKKPNLYCMRIIKKIIYLPLILSLSFLDAGCFLDTLCSS
nr:unnamed protein product [Callosobruchus analis]